MRLKSFLQLLRTHNHRKNVLIATNVIMLPGVTLGEGTIFGAGSVVTHDIPSDVLAAGNPCRVIKKNNFIKE